MDKGSSGIYTMQNYSAIKKNKQENPTICDNMDRPWRHYAKGIMLSVWNKSNRETNTVWSHLYVESENKNSEKDSDLWFLGVMGGKREYWRNVVKRYKLCYKINKL